MIGELVAEENAWASSKAQLPIATVGQQPGRMAWAGSPRERREMSAIVTEIQVGGGPLCNSLIGACQLFLGPDGRGRPKISFSIKLSNGEQRHITIRDDEQTVAYGDFEGLPSFLDYARESCEGAAGYDEEGRGNRWRSLPNRKNKADQRCRNREDR